MAQFDVRRSVSTGGLVVDCQSEMLDHLSTRFVIPLVTVEDAPKSVSRLNPRFQIDDQSMVLATQLAAGVPRSDLGTTTASLAAERYAIQAALDTLVGSY